MTISQEIMGDKALRRDTDAIIQRVKDLPASRERSLAITKLQEAVMWLGMDLKRINDGAPGAIADPYPNSKDPSNTRIDPTAERVARDAEDGHSGPAGSALESAGHWQGNAQGTSRAVGADARDWLDEYRNGHRAGCIALQHRAWPASRPQGRDGIDAGGSCLGPAVVGDRAGYRPQGRHGIDAGRSRIGAAVVGDRASNDERSPPHRHA